MPSFTFISRLRWLAVSLSLISWLGGWGLLHSAAATNTPPTLTTLSAQTLAEDTMLTVTLTVDDAESAASTLALAANSSNLSLLPPSRITLGGSGPNRTVTLAPLANQAGAAVITLTVSDGELSAATAFTVTVNAVNDAPTLTPLPNQTSAQGLARGPIPLTLGDVDSANLTVTGASSHPALLPMSNLTLGGSGGARTLTFTPTATLTGTATLTLTVSDGLSQTAQAFLVTVPALTHPPTALALTNTQVAENAPVGTLVGVFTTTDADAGDAHTYALVPGTNDWDNALFTVVNAELRTNALFDYEANDIYFIRARTTDSAGQALEQTFIITLTNVNETPIAQPDFAATLMGQSVTITVLSNDSQSDGDLLTLSAIGTPLTGTAQQLGNQVVYTPAANFAGADTFTYTLSDEQGALNQSSVTVLVNAALTTAVQIRPEVFTITQGFSLAIPVLANDTAPEPLALIYVGPSQVGQTAISGAQVLFIPHPRDEGFITFTYAALANTLGGSAVVTVNILPLNTPPQANNDSVITLAQTAVSLNVFANDSDWENNPLSLIALGQGAHGLAQTLGGGFVRYTPAAGFTGWDSFTYSISDGQGGVATAQVIVQVLATARHPQATRDTTLADEDTPRVINVLANDQHFAHTLQVVQVTQAQSGTVTLLPNGNVQYVPHANYFGPDEFAYTARDDQGLETTASVTLTVRPVLDAPQPNPVFGTTTQDTPLTLNVLAHMANPDARGLQITNYTQPTSGTITLNPDNSFTYTPTLGFVGFDPFAFTVSVSGTAASHTAWATIVVGNLSATAQTSSASLNLQAGQAFPLALLDYAQCPAVASGTGPWQLVGAQVSTGTLTAHSNGTAIYAPAPGFSGLAALTYTISDGQTCWGQGTLPLMVLPAARPANAVDDVFTVTEDVPATLTLTTNDYDLGGSPFTVTVVSPATYGQVMLNANGTVQYTPAPDSRTADTFAYALRNAQGVVDMATVTLALTNTPDAPRPQDDWAYTPEDSALFISVLANDIDPDGDTLTVQPGPAQHGTISVTPLGAVRYQPAPNFFGLDVFTYTVNDGHGGLAQATVAMTVINVNDTPVTNPDIASVEISHTVMIAILANDTDTEGTTLHLVTVQNSGAHGSAQVLGHQILYTAFGTPGQDILTYLVTDAQGAQTTGTVVVNVVEANAYTLFLPLIKR